MSERGKEGERVACLSETVPCTQTADLLDRVQTTARCQQGAHIPMAWVPLGGAVNFNTMIPKYK